MQINVDNISDVKPSSMISVMSSYTALIKRIISAKEQVETVKQSIAGERTYVKPSYACNHDRL